MLTKRPENIERMLPTATFTEHDRVQSTDKPRPNLWLGTSVGHRSRLGCIDELRKIPAAIRFLSVEPLLEDLGPLDLAGIHWVIVGGESGSGSRPCDLAWIRNVVHQCRAAGVTVFVKQLGAVPSVISNSFAGDLAYLPLRHKKGGDMAEWPEDLRIREFPKAVLA